MGRMADMFSVNCCFLTTVGLILAILIPLAWPGPNQPIINAVQRKNYREIHRLVEEQLDTIQKEWKLHPEKKTGKHKKPQIDDIDFGAGRKVMHIAAIHGDVPILKYFRKRGAGIHWKKERDDRTPLHLAATFGTVDVVKQLIAWGAEVDAKAIVSFQTSFVPRVDVPRQFLLHLYSIQSYVVLFLLPIYCATNCPLFQSGWTPLIKAVLLSNHDIVEVLLAAGADPDCSVDGSFNALQCALIYSDQHMIYLLIKAGAYLEEGEQRFDEFQTHYQNILNAGFLKESDLPQRKLNRKRGALTGAGVADLAQREHFDDDEEDEQGFHHTIASTIGLSRDKVNAVKDIDWGFQE